MVIKTIAKASEVAMRTLIAAATSGNCFYRSHYLTIAIIVADI